LKDKLVGVVIGVVAMLVSLVFPGGSLH
jgi:hypothetical protein